MENILSCAVPTIWFDRGEVFDRSAVTDRMKEHVATPGALPILIFPEGTCINNTSVMKFKKGCFEVGAVIHPVAIKVRPLLLNKIFSMHTLSLVHKFTIIAMIDIPHKWLYL